MTLEEVRTPRDSPARRFSPQELSAGRAVLGNSFPVRMGLDYAARPVPSIRPVGIDGLALDSRDRSSEREAGLLGLWALLALAVTIATARAYGSARRALAIEFTREFAHISDAIDHVPAATWGIAVLNGGELRQSRIESLDADCVPVSRSFRRPLVKGRSQCMSRSGTSVLAMISLVSRPSSHSISGPCSKAPMTRY